VAGAQTWRQFNSKEKIMAIEDIGKDLELKTKWNELKNCYQSIENAFGQIEEIISSIDGSQLFLEKSDAVEKALAQKIKNVKNAFMAAKNQ
jgi:hypothetical protein